MLKLVAEIGKQLKIDGSAWNPDIRAVYLDVFERQLYRDRRPQSNLTLYIQLTSMEVSNLLDDSQTQSRSAMTGLWCGISFVEWLCDA